MEWLNGTKQEKTVSRLHVLFWKSRATPCGICSTKVSSVVDCLKLMGANSCLRLYFRQHIFYASRLCNV